MNWYKYTRSEFARALVEQGRLRLSKIEIYHDVDRLGDAIGDVEEGYLTLAHPIDSATVADLGEFERQFFDVSNVTDVTAPIIENMVSDQVTTSC